MAVKRTGQPTARPRHETHQLTEAARQHIDASLKLIPTASLGQKNAVQEPENRPAAAADVALPQYSQLEWQLLADMLQTAEEAASWEQKQGQGTGQVTLLKLLAAYEAILKLCRANNDCGPGCCIATRVCSAAAEETSSLAQLAAG
ncbi:hypothetical protein WJX73_001314 [Symbiochloris irregularis]|uniref:Uncharacterized protein n=1 Tax=Symbiochloris irregularis TaxID=706552 RepID=A0AAW1PM60_9CHLO